MNPTLRACLALATAGTVLLACSEASPTTADLPPSVAVVHGQVTAEQGAPVPGAFVRVMVYQPTAAGGCVADRPALAGTGYSDARGDFSIRGQYLHFARVRLCVSVETRPPQGSGFDAATVAGGTVDFIHETLVPPIDSLRVDVVLRPSG